jgi:hypothetical protein
MNKKTPKIWHIFLETQSIYCHHLYYGNCSKSGKSPYEYKICNYNDCPIKMKEEK